MKPGEAAVTTGSTSLAVLRAAVRSTAGSHGRRGPVENQDRGVADPVRGLLLVADGMGGLPLATASADRAAAMVVEFLGAGSDAQSLGAAVKSAGSVVTDMARTAGVDRTGTTLCAGLVHLDRLHVANLGDSRCYLVRDGTAAVLTLDHTPAARLIAEGTIEAGSPAAADLSRSLDRYLGRGDSMPDLDSHKLLPGDRILFCTDGVHRALSHEALTTLLVSRAAPGRVAEQLIDASRRAGATDDATAVVADVGVRPETLLSVTSSVGGALLGPGEAVTVGRAGHGADLGFDDGALHRKAARLSVRDSDWILENTGRSLYVRVRDRRSVLTSVAVPPLRTVVVPFTDADVVITTVHADHTFRAGCFGMPGVEAVVAPVSDDGAGYSYPFDRSTAQFRTLVAVAEPVLLGNKRKERMTAKRVYRRLRGVEPGVTLKAVSRRLDELCDKMLEGGSKDLDELGRKAVITGTVTHEDLSLIGESPDDEPPDEPV